MAGAAPRYGMCATWMPVWRSKSSMVTCGKVPLPADA
jgi:hypothetical protein